MPLFPPLAAELTGGTDAISGSNGGVLNVAQKEDSSVIRMHHSPVFLPYALRSKSFACVLDSWQVGTGLVIKRRPTHGGDCYRLHDGHIAPARMKDSEISLSYLDARTVSLRFTFFNHGMRKYIRAWEYATTSGKMQCLRPVKSTVTFAGMLCGQTRDHPVCPFLDTSKHSAKNSSDDPEFLFPKRPKQVWFWDLTCSSLCPGSSGL
ncbi:unnamed protein product [Scytosiphon promiscuus]